MPKLRITHYIPENHPRNCYYGWMVNGLSKDGISFVGFGQSKFYAIREARLNLFFQRYGNTLS